MRHKFIQIKIKKHSYLDSVADVTFRVPTYKKTLPEKFINTVKWVTSQLRADRSPARTLTTPELGRVQILAANVRHRCCHRNASMTNKNEMKNSKRRWKPSMPFKEKSVTFGKVHIVAGIGAEGTAEVEEVVEVRD